MDSSQFLEIKAAIEKKLIFEIAEEAEKIDVGKHPQIRFTLEFSFDEKGLLADAGVETRYRRALK